MFKVAATLYSPLLPSAQPPRICDLLPSQSAVVSFISGDSRLAQILQCGCKSDFICSFIEIIKSRGLRYIKFEVVIAQTPVLI